MQTSDDERERVTDQRDTTGKTASARPESSTTRVLGILDLFTVETPLWSAERLIEKLGLGRATIYRYLRELTEAGFLVPTLRNGYVLGPRFIEFDRQIRLADPLLRVGRPILAESRDVVNGMQLLCGFYGDRVLTIFQDKVDPSIEETMERGRPLSLLRGAPSKIILAHLPPYHLKNLYLHQARDIESAGIGASWTEFRAQLKAIRTAGHYRGSELDPHLVGLAAPVFNAPDTIIGSVCMIRKTADLDAAGADLLRDLAIDAGKRISALLQSENGGGVGAPHAFPTARTGR